MAPKRTSLTIERKIEIMDKLQEGESISYLADQYHVCLETIRRIQREGNKLINYATKGKHELWKKKMRTSKFEDLENQLYTWFFERRTMGDPLTDLLLQEKALEISREMGAPSSFQASRGWLTKFKNRHNIRLFQLHGEQGGADVEAAGKFVQDFLKKVEDEKVKPENVYNMDETGLMWKAVPSKTLAVASVTHPKGKKVEKDRVTVGLCANASGTHKLPPIFIHKYKKPKALRISSSLPVIYKDQKQAFMDKQIFAEWYKNDFKSSVRKYQLENGISGKVILLVDNCRSHTSQESEDDQFEIQFLPPNTTALLQPMEQGIVAKMKQMYRYKMLQKVLRYEGGVEQFHKEYNIKDCITILDEAWRSVTQNNIKNAWTKIFIHFDPEEMYESMDTSIHSEISRIIETITGHTAGLEDALQYMTECEDAENSFIGRESASEDETLQDEEEIREELEQNVQKEEEERKNKDLKLAYELIKKHVYTPSMLPVVQAVIQMVKEDKKPT